jgi:hypothetical protein
MIERIRSISKRARDQAAGNAHTVASEVAYLVAELADVLEQVLLSEQCRAAVSKGQSGGQEGETVTRFRAP